MQKDGMGWDISIDKVQLSDFFSFPPFLFFQNSLFLFNTPTFSETPAFLFPFSLLSSLSLQTKAHHISLIILYLHSTTMADELNF